MFSRGVLFVFLFAVLKATNSAPIEKIKPVDLNHRCFHLKNGNQNKSPILLIHGLGSSLVEWSKVMEVLSLGTGRRVCAVDLRNHGDSPRADRFEVEAMTADIENFLDKEGIKKVNIIGHSLGGKISVHYSLNNPERVDSVVVEDMRPNGVSQKGLSTVVGFIKILQVAIKKVPDGASEEDARKSILNTLKTSLGKAGVKEKVDDRLINVLAIRQVNGKWQWKVDMDAVNKGLQNPNEFLTESTGLYKGPTLFIYGTESQFDIAGDKDNIMKLFPNAKLIPIEGAGHLIHISFRQFTDEVIKMLNNID